MKQRVVVRCYIFRNLHKLCNSPWPFLCVATFLCPSTYQFVNSRRVEHLFVNIHTIAAKLVRQRLQETLYHFVMFVVVRHVAWKIKMPSVARLRDNRLFESFGHQVPIHGHGFQVSLFEFRIACRNACCARRVKVYKDKSTAHNITVGCGRFRFLHKNVVLLAGIQVVVDFVQREICLHRPVVLRVIVVK